ncbi:hypothetical protein SAMN05443668_12480 [Cryptosporangium aurantiacum]|uniref:Uncharacterized protein n=1 Tax=Cryptosporangium aurantiacum TaxID=134849 RepID=A0A1M7RN67_9ACTN|nr:hypothetical protein SAMN05443668_12480 [Cryptosporangium aurantiacum]
MAITGRTGTTTHSGTVPTTARIGGARTRAEAA